MSSHEATDPLTRQAVDRFPRVARDEFNAGWTPRGSGHLYVETFAELASTLDSGGDLMAAVHDINSVIQNAGKHDDLEAALARFTRHKDEIR